MVFHRMQLFNKVILQSLLRIFVFNLNFRKQRVVIQRMLLQLLLYRVKLNCNL